MFSRVLRHPGYNGDIADDWLGLDPNGGGIYDIPIVGDIADSVINSFVGNVVAFAFPPAAPFIYAAKSAQALASGNELNALLNAVGAYTAYTSPNLTTTGKLGGMEVSGLNANLVKAAEQAIAGGTSVTDIAKTLVGVGNQTVAQDVLTKAGVSAEQATEILNNVGQQVMDATLTADDAARAIGAMQASGMSAADIAANVETFSTVIPKDQIANSMANIGLAPSIAGLPAPISNAGFYTAGTLTDGVPAELAGPHDYQIDASGFTDPSYLDGPPVEPPQDYSSSGGTYTEPYVGGEHFELPPSGPDVSGTYNSGMDSGDYFGEAVDTSVAPRSPYTVGLDEQIPDSFSSTSLLDKAKSLGSKFQSLKNIFGTSGTGGTGGTSGTGTGGSGGTADFNQRMSLVDPYRGYRLNTEIPMMGDAAGAAGTLSGLYQKSFTDPVGVYNTPEMQALNQQFMQETARKDAALGRNSQYGARGVEAQNQFLTKALPQYRTGLQQGLGTYYGAAKSQPLDFGAATNVLSNTAVQNALAGGRPSGLAGTVSGLEGSWNQMTQGDNIFDQIQGGINTASGLQDLYTGGQQAYNTISGWFA